MIERGCSDKRVGHNSDGTRIEGHVIIEGIRIAKHVFHICYFPSIPGRERLIKARRLVKHGIHVRDFRSVEIANVLVKGFRPRKHTSHIFCSGRVPVIERLVKGLGTFEGASKVNAV